MLIGFIVALLARGGKSCILAFIPPISMLREVL